MSQLKIDQAFVQTFIDGAFGLEIAHENFDFDPTPGTAYARLWQIPNPEVALSLNDTNETTGIFRIALYFPENKSAFPAKTKAGEIEAVYKIGSEIAFGGQKVRITSTERQRGVPEEGWYKLIISIAYIAFITR